MKILPACFVVVGETVEEAQAKRAMLDSKVNYANAIASLSIALGTDASKFDPDKPLPDDIPESNASQERPRARDRARQARQSDGAPARAAHGRLFGGLAMVGTPKTIADEMEEWLETEASDGFTVHVPLSARRARRFLPPASFPSCSAAACSAANTKGRRCARISACRGRTTASSRHRPRAEWPQQHERDQNYHAHVYYDAATRERAHALCDAAGETFGIKVGRMHDNPVGPHPRGSCQLTVQARSSSPT